MRKLRWIDISEDDTQQCLEDLNSNGFARFGIRNEGDIVSVQREMVDMGGKLTCVLWVFYWSDD
jgi:hypothetical protein